MLLISVDVHCSRFSASILKESYSDICFSFGGGGRVGGGGLGDNKTVGEARSVVNANICFIFH